METAKKDSLEFVKFLGGCALAGKQVAIYRDARNSEFILRAETVGGKPLSFKAREDGKFRFVTVKDMRFSADAMQAFEDQITHDLYNKLDARIVQRALAYMGYQLC